MLVYAQVRFLVIAAAHEVTSWAYIRHSRYWCHSLTIPRKQIKLKSLHPLSLTPSREDEGRGANNFTSQEEKFIERSGHWRHRVYRNPIDRSVYPKRSASPLSPLKTSDLMWPKGLPIEFVHSDCNDKTSETTTYRWHRKADWL